jgi:outer membrane protein OmpA-like peptidoglycan-associated protein
MRFIISKTAAAGLFVQLACLAPAKALDWQVDTARNLGAPGYLPYAGEIEGSFTYTYSASTYDFRNNFAPFPSDYDRSENNFLPQLTYGITDDIAVFATLGFGNSRNFEHDTYNRLVITPTKPQTGPGGIPFQPPPLFSVVPTPTTGSYHALGANDPSFGATWRVIDQRTAPISLDISGSYAPDIFHAQVSQQDRNGSFASGGQSGSIEAAITHDSRFLTLRAYGTFGYDARRNLSTGYGTQDLRSAPHAVYSAGLQSEARLLPYLAVNAGIGASQAMRFDQPILGTFGQTPVTIKPSGTISPYAGLVLPFIPQRLVGEFLYQHDFVNDETHDYPYGQIDRYFKQGGNEYIARVLVTFGGSSTPLQAAAPSLPPPIPHVYIDRTYLVFFDWDRADLSTRARQIVAEAAQASTRDGITRIEADGYTDLSGSAAYNRQLSIRRARAVATELVRNGVSESEISIHGYGESNPLVPTKPGVREAQNRRVEIIFK